MRVRLGELTVDGTDAAAAWEIRTGATPGRARIMEIGFTLVAATASVIGLGRPAVIGDTPVAPVDFLPSDPDDVIASGVVQSATSWAVAGPTVPASFIARASFPATVGAGIVWTFPEGLVIPVSDSVVLWNLATNSVLNAWAVVEI